MKLTEAIRNVYEASIPTKDIKFNDALKVCSELKAKANKSKDDNEILNYSYQCSDITLKVFAEIISSIIDHGKTKIKIEDKNSKIVITYKNLQLICYQGYQELSNMHGTFTVQSSTRYSLELFKLLKSVASVNKVDVNTRKRLNQILLYELTDQLKFIKRHTTTYYRIV